MLKTLLKRSQQIYEHESPVLDEVIAIMHPDWRGIRSSTDSLFETTFYLGDTETAEEIEHFANVIIDTGVKVIVLSGFPSTYSLLVELIHKKSKSIKVYCLWHGSFMQSNEEYNWNSFKEVKRLCEEKKIHKWGFVKKGMAEIMHSRFGIHTAFVMNYIEEAPRAAVKLPEEIVKIGLWAISPNWRKNPYAMIAATSIIPKAKIFGFGQSEHVKEYVNFFNIPSEIKSEPLPQSKMLDFLSTMHLNLYVTMSECAPMTPLESLAAGSPCLIGPNSHYFEDNDYLRERLVVSHPDKAHIISKYIVRALEDRESIINEYRKYAQFYNADAKLSFKKFIQY